MKVTGVTVRVGLIEAEQNTPVRCGLLALPGRECQVSVYSHLLGTCMIPGFILSLSFFQSYIPSRLIKGVMVCAIPYSNITAILPHRCSVVTVYPSPCFSFIDRNRSTSLRNVPVTEACHHGQEDV